MTAAVYRGGTPSLAGPQTQNTALVLEFNCLYTHDIRRKQKRWQDGFLRFHTFNKRVMVYDVPRNFVGDTHWKEGGDLQDGDEVTLEREGVLVQVTESVSKTQTDLTELRQSAKKRSSEYGSSSPAKAAPNQTLRPIPKSTTSKPRTQLKHRSLNALLGTPKGPIGKAALPSKSPFEERAVDVENEAWEDGRPPKRQRMGEQSAWSVTRTTTTAKPPVKTKPSLGPRSSDSANHKKKAAMEAGQQRFATKEVIDLSSDTNGPERFLPNFSSDTLAPVSSPPKQQPQVAKPPTVRSSSPAFQTQKIPDGPRQRQADENAGRAGSRAFPERRVSVERPASPTEVQRMRQQPRDPPRARKSASEDRRDESVVDMQVETAQSMRPSSNRSGKTLRMTADAPKKKTLLCQDQLPKKAVRVHSANTENAIESLLDATKHQTRANKPKPKSQRKQLQDRLARIRKKSDVDADKGLLDHEDSAVDLPPRREVEAILGHRPSTPPEEAAAELIRLNQRSVPSPRPGLINSPVAPAATDRQLRRVVSEANNVPSNRPKRIPGAPVCITPSPAKKASPPAAQTLATEDASLQRPIIPAPPKTRAKKPLQKSVSYNTTSNGTTTVILGRAFQAPKPPKPKVALPKQCANPWSREAFDLFTWRPPGWDEAEWSVKTMEA